MESMNSKFTKNLNHRDNRLEVSEDVSFRNQERARKVEAREGKQKYYCALKARYKIGDIILGKSTNSDTRNPSVFLTTSVEPHFTLEERGDLDTYTIYRVVPIGKIKPGFEWAELSAKSVEVVEVLGSAKSFVEKKQFGHVQLKPNLNPLHKILKARYEKEHHEINEQKPNETGKKLLDKIDKKFGLT